MSHFILQPLVTRFFPLVSLGLFSNESASHLECLIFHLTHPDFETYLLKYPCIDKILYKLLILQTHMYA